MITTLAITGMTCNRCVKHVDEALRALPGVSVVEVELTAGRAKIAHDPAQSDVPALVRAIAAAGYEAST